MSLTRPATSAETPRLWPAVRSARIFATAEEFSAFRDASPWRVRVTDAGESVVLGPWRVAGELLAIRGLWAARERVPVLIDDTASVARTQGFQAVLSPLLGEGAFGPYEQAGMEVREHIVALQGFAAEIRSGALPDGICLRAAGLSDLGALEAIDAQCFDSFWRFGRAELESALARERVVVATDDRGPLAYASCSLHGAAATLGRLAVSPQARRRGVGTALIGGAAAWAARQQAYALTLCTQRCNENSRRLYGSLGMHELAEPFVIAVRAL